MNTYRIVLEEPDESLLNLYASYDLIGYFQLVDHYSKKVSYQVSGGIRWEKKCGLSFIIDEFRGMHQCRRYTDQLEEKVMILV